MPGDLEGNPFRLFLDQIDRLPYSKVVVRTLWAGARSEDRNCHSLQGRYYSVKGVIVRRTQLLWVAIVLEDPDLDRIVDLVAIYPWAFHLEVDLARSCLEVEDVCRRTCRVVAEEGEDHFDPNCVDHREALILFEEGHSC